MTSVISCAKRVKQENRAFLRVEEVALAIKTPFDILVSGYQPLIRSKGVFLCQMTIKV